MNNNVSVIVPCRNERLFIKKCLDSVMNQDYSAEQMEVLVVDGMSTDGTREIIKSYCDKYSCIKILDNPSQYVAAALNIGIKASQGKYIIRIDVHTEYDSDYIRACIEELIKTNADNVGGPWVAEGRTYLQKAIALAFQSPFSSGGARSHSSQHNGYVDSVYLGCWKKSTLEQLGYFDEEFVRNQDDELNFRIIRSGGSIWQSTRIRSIYYPRATLISLFKQYMQYGYWKVKTIQKHRIPASIRHIIPGSLIITILILLILSLISVIYLKLLAVLLCCYLIANLSVSFWTCRKGSEWKYCPVMPAIFGSFHYGYGIGFLFGLLSCVTRGPVGKTFTKLTRN